MAYISYDSRHAHRSARVRPRLETPFAWGRILAIAGSVVFWAGIIAAARVIF